MDLLISSKHGVETELDPDGTRWTVVVSEDEEILGVPKEGLLAVPGAVCTRVVVANEEQ
jgi:hypothetical protein